MEDGYIEPAAPREQVRPEPYPLPKDFEWASIDLDNPNQVNICRSPRIYAKLIILPDQRSLRPSVPELCGRR